MRVGLFGSFYPHASRAGNSTTGLAFLLSRSPRVTHVTVFGPRDSDLPAGLDPERVSMIRSWSYDDPPGLVGTLLRILRLRNQLDLIIFNIYPTSFGRNPISNGVGMLLPVLAARISGLRTITYLHNLLETQDAGQLGYRPGWISRSIVRVLERAVLNSTTGVVSLASMGARVREQLGVPVNVSPLPFIESVYSALCGDRPPVAAWLTEPSSSIRVLLFGSWGPQKDLGSALDSLRTLIAAGADLRVTVAGEVNPNFPDFRSQMDGLFASLPADRFHLAGRIPEGQVYSLVRSFDALFLPYRTSGGYSGAMNCAGLAGTPVVAYSVPQLIEYARDLEIDAFFFLPGDAQELRRALEHAKVLSDRRPQNRWGPDPVRVGEAIAAADRLLNAGAPDSLAAGSGR